MENADKKILACGERNTSIVAIDSTGIEIFDTTLRDGAQGEGISFSLSDKIAVVKALDELGIAYIEAGNPGSNPKDIEFFKSAKKT
ncbi:MAG: hypothetical protein Ta2B_12710 [Termitinemataceae bacterium]|nr:MAG: hypothetical protein Ta2B_12710 [Termitinemataceae bacterium]